MDLCGLGQALRQLLTRKRVVLTDLPAAARSWYGCEARMLSLVLQTLHALDYRAPEPPVVKRPAAKKPAVKKRRRRRRRRRRRVRRRVRQGQGQGLTPRRR